MLVAWPASAAPEPFEPAGTVLEGIEKHPDIGKAPATFHLGADGTVAASVIDTSATAFGWTGTWSLEDGVLHMDIPAPSELADDLTVSLTLNPKGRGKGTMVRDGLATTTSSLKVKCTYPAKKAKGWTAVTSPLRTGFTTAAGDFRSTLTIRRVDVVKSKRQMKAMALTARALTPGGLPGLPVPVLVPPDGVARFSAGSFPPLPPGVDPSTLQVEITGGKDFVPESVVVGCVEEVLRGIDPAPNGASVPVHWVKALKKKEAAGLVAAPLAAAHFRDDGGAGPTPRETVLHVRDLAPLAALPPTGAVRVAVLEPDGTEIGAADVTLRPRAAAAVRLRDLIGAGELAGHEGQLRITRADGGPLTAGTVAASLAGTVAAGGLPVSSTQAPVEPPWTPRLQGPEQLAVLPLLLAPPNGDDAGSATVVVANTDATAATITARILALDGTLLHEATVGLAAGAAVRIDPDALGVDREDVPGGECQVVIAGANGDRLALRAEFTKDGEPATVFGLPFRFEGPSAAGAGVVFHVPDAQEALGSAAGSRDAWFVLRNGSAAARDVVIRAILDDGTPVVPASTTVSVPAGAAARLSAETLLALLGAPVEPLPAVWRGSFVLEAEEGDGAPWTAVGLALRYSANATGGHDVPLPRR